MAKVSNKFKPEETNELIEKVVKINRVTKTVKGGRNFSFNTVMVVGDGKGRVGHGLGKALEITNAISKGVKDAKGNMIKAPIINGTIPHQVIAKHCGARVLLKPAAPGTGVIAGGVVRAVLEGAGYTDILSKSMGSSNAHNLVKATIKGLKMMKTETDVMRLRGVDKKKLYELD